MVGYKKFTSKISGKGHSGAFYEENRCVSAAIVAYHTENMDTDI